jgi:hypothetical protein
MRWVVRGMSSTRRWLHCHSRGRGGGPAQTGEEVFASWLFPAHAGVVPSSLGPQAKALRRPRPRGSGPDMLTQ